MVGNQFVSCNVCKTVINFRIQYGDFDIPFNLKCPQCTTHIHGKMHLSEDSYNLGFTISNAKKTSQPDDGYYTAELSAEFLTRKLRYRYSDEEWVATPFIRSLEFNDDFIKNREEVSALMNFPTYIKKEWPNHKLMYNLLWSEKEAELYPRINKEIKKHSYIAIKEVNSKLDAVMSLHQLFLISSGIGSTILKDALPEYMSVAKLIMNPKIKDEVLEYLNETTIDLIDIERKGFQLIDRFFKFYDQLIPIISIRNLNTLDSVDRHSLGIMTANFDELTDFYAKSYEWILDNLNMIIALNNIITRGNYKECYNGKDYQDVVKISSKFKKLDYMDPLEQLSKPTDSLNNKVRNAIQHFDCEIEYTTQKAKFTDTYRGKEKIEEIYLIDFCVLCIENFGVIIYLIEIVYNLHKTKLVSLENRPTVNQNIR